MLKVYTCIVQDHDLRLVALAALVCTLASFTAMGLLHHVRNSTGLMQKIWLVVVATSCGFGIWATHFIAMLAFAPGIPSGYNIALTALSLVAAIILTGCGFATALSRTLPGANWLGGAIVGGGIAVMHYTGMAAFEIQGRIVWDPVLVAVSIAAGGVIGAAATRVGLIDGGGKWKVYGALLLTVAIVSHHFTAMGAAGIIPDPTMAVPESAMPTTWLAIAVAASSIGILLLALTGLTLDIRDRRLVDQSAWWTRIHLIYFALAAFDLTAIGAGIWLSNFTKGEFEDSVHSFRIGDLIRDNGSAIFDAANSLAKPAGRAFETRDTAAALKELQAASAAFDTALSTDHFGDVEAKTVLETAIMAAGGNKELIDEHGGLKLFFPEVFVSYDAIESRLKAKKAAVVAASEAAIRSLAEGRTDESAQHLNRSDEAGRLLVAEAGKIFGISAIISDETVEESVMAFSFAESLQYAIGGAILLMIGMVCVYARFVGTVLRRKFAELEHANKEATEFAGKVQHMNDEVTGLNLQLAANVRKLTEAQDEIVRRGKMAQLGQLTATVAHELRNPLGAVRTSAFLLHRKVNAKELGIEQQIERIQNGVVRCDHIITQLLDFSGSKTLHCEAADFDAWLEKLVSEETEKLPAAVQVMLEQGLGARKVSFDAARLSRVIINLMSNASEAMVGKGDDRSKYTTAAPQIAIATRLTGRGIELTVKDNGPGIPEKNLGKILEPLFTTKSFGTGLGLPAAESILHEHGGGLEVASRPGEGACFTAWIPFSNAGQEAA